MVPLRSSPVWLPDSSSLPFKCIVHYLNPFGRKQHTPVCNLFLQSDCERPTLICIAVTNVTAIPHSHGTLQGAGLYERMKYPVIIRSTGMMFLYSLIPTYATQRMPYKYLSSWICTMLTVRMVLAPSIGTALYTNVLQERQQHYVTRYAQNVDMLHPEASASFTQTVQGMQYQGKSKQEAINMAAISTKGRIQVQATLSAVKEMAGWTLYACLICMIFVLVVRYPKRKLLT